MEMIVYIQFRVESSVELLKLPGTYFVHIYFTIYNFEHLWVLWICMQGFHVDLDALADVLLIKASTPLTFSRIYINVIHVSQFYKIIVYKKF